MCTHVHMYEYTTVHIRYTIQVHVIQTFEQTLNSPITTHLVWPLSSRFSFCRRPLSLLLLLARSFLQNDLLHQTRGRFGRVLCRAFRDTVGRVEGIGDFLEECCTHRWTDRCCSEQRLLAILKLCVGTKICSFITLICTYVHVYERIYYLTVNESL